jgi:hypothetical protein
MNTPSSQLTVPRRDTDILLVGHGPVGGALTNLRRIAHATSAVFTTAPNAALDMLGVGHAA